MLNVTLPNQKARELVAELKKAASRLEGESILIGGYYHFITVETWEKYAALVDNVLKTYKKFKRALNDDGVR